MGDTDKRIIIGAYFSRIKFNRREMRRIYRLALTKMKEKCSYNHVVLLGTKDLMHEADRVFAQRNPDIVRASFDMDKETAKIMSLPQRIPVHCPYGYLDNGLQEQIRDN